MSDGHPKETMIDTHVTYAIELAGRVIVVEKVPARVCVETGERFYAPQTVERIHQIIHGKDKPSRTITTPVYEFAA